MEEDFADFNKDLIDVHTTVENIDNALENNNVWERGLKEGLEGSDLKDYLTDLLTSCVSTGSDIITSIC